MQMEEMLLKSNRDKDEYFENIQKEMKRIKKESQDLIKSVVKQNDEKYRQELLSLQETVAKLKSSHHNEMICIDNNIQQMNVSIQKEV